MFNFTLSSGTFNGLLKRLVSLSGNDKTAIISFVLNDGLLEVYYNSKLDKSDSSSYFYEKLEVDSYTGDGQSSLFLSNLFSVKVPEYVDDHKFPYCKGIKFSFEESLLNISFSIHWGMELTPNTTNLRFSLLKDLEDLDSYAALFSDKFKSYFEVDSKELRRSISLCNFIKSDVTSKENNGCLITVLSNPKQEAEDFFIVNTDSNLAIRHAMVTKTNSLEKDVSIVLTPQILNAVRNFISEDGTSKLSSFKSQLYIEVGNRRMLVPVMRMKYLIEDPIGFFTNTSPLVAVLDLKPTLTLATSLVNKSTNPLKKLDLAFVADGLGTESFNLSTDTDLTENIPCKITKEAYLKVNGSFFITAAQRILNLSLECNLYFDSNNHRITMTSESGDMIFLIQGLYNV